MRWRAFTCGRLARAWGLAPKGAANSPWDVRDGFRIAQPPVIRVPLLLGERSLNADVVAISLSAGTVRVDGKTFQLEFEDSFRPVLQWYEPGGAGADVLVKPHAVEVWLKGEKFTFTLNDGSQFESSTAAHAGSLTTPLPGVVVSVAVKEGDVVAAGQTLLVIEAMKMEHAIKAPRAGTVKSVKHKAGDRVREGSTLAEIE